MTFFYSAHRLQFSTAISLGIKPDRTSYPKDKSIFREEEGWEIGRKMNAVVKGTTDLKLETIKDHEIFKIHRVVARLKPRNKKKLIQNTTGPDLLSEG